MKKRITAFLMVALLLLSIMPLNGVWAEEVAKEKGGDTYSIAVEVKDTNGKAIKEKEVSYTLQVGEMIQSGTFTSDDFGASTIDISDEGLIEAIKGGEEVTVSYKLDDVKYSSRVAETTCVITDTPCVLVVKKMIDVTLQTGVEEKHGTVKVNVGDDEIVDGGNLTVEEGEEVTVTISPDEGYMISRATIGEENQEIEDKTVEQTITFTASSNDTTIEVFFVKYHTVTLRGNENGTLSIDGKTSLLGGEIISFVEENGSAVVQAEPEEHYRIESVSINGEDVDFSEDIVEGIYTKEFADITEDYLVEILFVPVTYQVTVEIEGTGTVYCNDNEVKNGDKVSVTYGETATFDLYTEGVNYLSGIYVNDEDENRVADSVLKEDGSGSSYETNAITEDRTLKFVFESTEESEEVPTYTGVEGIYNVSYENGSYCRDFTEYGIKKIVVQNNTKVRITPVEGFRWLSYYDFNVWWGWCKSPIIEKNVNVTDNIYIKNLVAEYYGGASPCSTTPIQFIADASFESLTVEDPTSEKGIYRDDFEVSVSASDALSGLSSVSYWITDDEAQEHITVGEDAPIVLFENGTEYKASGNWTITVPVDETMNNTEYVKVHVVAKDVAGNETTQVYSAKVNTKAPEITVDMDATKATTENYYKAPARVATIQVEDKEYSFETDCLLTAIASELQKDDVTFEKSDIEDMLSLEAEEFDAETGITTYIYKLNFDADAHYSWDLTGFTNLAGSEVATVNSTASEHPFDFYVDYTAPDIKMETTTDMTWFEHAIHFVTFGKYINYSVTIEAEGTDEVSNPVSITYYKQNVPSNKEKTETLSVEALNALYESGSFVTKPYTTGASEAVCIYARAEDKAGNVSYATTDGIVVDAKPIQIEVVPETSSENGYYNSDVTMQIHAVDEEENEVASGLVSLEYKVWQYAAGQDLENIDFDGIASEQVTQSGVLVSNDIGAEYEGDFVVEASKNNVNNVAVSVKAVDKAGNITVKTTSLMMDTTKPVINISYDNNNGKGIYYAGSRVATIEVVERNFDASDVVFDIQTVGGSAPVISGWTVEAGSGNGDNTKHVATITYQADGDYTFGVSYTDLAGNTCSVINYATGTQNPNQFTIDKTAPVVSVSYDNNDVKNGKYFKAGRTATITVVEHNFDASGVELTNVNGSNISWSTNGDTHTGVISYTTDGACMLQVSYTDKAGNACTGVDYGTSASPNDFIVDQTIEKPVITGVSNGSSYKDDVTPSVSFTDENYSNVEISLHRTRANQKNVDVTSEFLPGVSESETGCEAHFANMEKEIENDGIYTLTVTAMDLAGNEETQKVTFTLNRFGSVYAFSDYLINIQEAYVNDIEDDLVITEYNADPLVEDSLQIEITCDGSPIEEVKYQATAFETEADGVGESGWYQYEYVIDRENFEKDGVYKIVVSSEDTVGNKPETTNFEENFISFCVDTTPAEITNIQGLESEVVNAEAEKVSFEVFDAIGIKKVDVYVEDMLVQTFEEIDNRINFTGSFDLDQGTNQHVRFVVSDLAGNITDTDEKDAKGNYVFAPTYDFNRDVTVSTNLWVRILAHKTAILVTTGSVAVAGGAAGTGTVFFRRRKIRVK